MRAKVRADGYRSVDTMLFTSTHDESAPDTIGITGPNQFTSGVDPFYVQFLVAGAARSIERAATRLTPAVIRYGSVHPNNLVTCWSSYPFVADEDIGAMQARSVRDGHVIVTMANYGIHAEELGFSSPTQDSLHLSSDWPHFARTALEARYGGMAMTVSGAVGLGRDAPGVPDPAQLRARRRVQLDGQRRLPDHLRHRRLDGALRLHAVDQGPRAAGGTAGPRPPSTRAPGLGRAASTWPPSRSSCRSATRCSPSARSSGSSAARPPTSTGWSCRGGRPERRSGARETSSRPTCSGCASATAASPAPPVSCSRTPTSARSAVRATRPCPTRRGHRRRGSWPA